MAHSILHEQLQVGSLKKIQLKINDNRSTMLSVRWDPHCTKVSLHRLFLDAPNNIMQDLACYVRQEQSNISPMVRAFIEEKLKGFDYSHEIDTAKLSTQGRIYDLQKIYDDLNREYFKSALNLRITWFGKHSSKGRSRVTFGLYHDPIRLIKINRLLDSPSFPDYLVAYVVYHEMLHHVCPSYYDKRGIHQVHSKEFKEQETLYKHYHRAQEWIKEHSEHFFYMN